MRSANTQLIERARTIFDRLGYTLDGEGADFRAERAWKSVHVTATDRVPEMPESGDLRCFVTYRDTAEELRETLLTTKPPYDWAIISVDDSQTATDGGYDVIHPPQDVVR